MNGDLRKIDPGQETEGPSREELRSAHDLVLAMVKTAKGLRMYLPNNPVLVKFVEELCARMAAHMTSYGDFRLEVERFSLRYRGADVYQNLDPKESIAFRLYADGIRALLLSHGMEQKELVTFLDIIGVERPSQTDDDIVTKLWEQSLPHINYLLEEDFIDAGWLDDEPVVLSQQEAVSRIHAFIERSSPLPPRVVPQHLLMLTGPEAAWLGKAVKAEVLRDPIDDMVSILSAILAGAKEQAIFDDFLEITGKLTVNMFLAGDIAHALRLVRFLSQLAHLASLGPGQRKQVASLLAGILSERTLQVLQETLDHGDTVSHDDLKELLEIFGLPSLGQICELLGRVEKLKVRKVIVEVLVELGGDDPRVFAPFLSDPRWYLVRNVVLVLSLLASPVALEMIARLVSHKEARIRKEVLGFLERSPDPKAKSYLVRFLRDDSSALRIKALQILGREKPPFALKPVLALAAADDFRSRDLAERKAVYETLGELGSESTIPLFREMLLKKSWFKTVDREGVLCAVAGLLKMRSAAALELLEEARRQRNVEIRGIVEQAIASLSAGHARAAAGSGEV